LESTAFYGLKIDFIIGWNLTAIVMLKSYFGSNGYWYSMYDKKEVISLSELQHTA